MMQQRFSPKTSRQPQSRRARPRLELLEDRTAPATFVVNSLADGAPAADGNLTLREAVTAATTNAASGDAGPGETNPDTIVFAQSILGGTITLTQGELTLNGGGDLSIVGPSPGSPTGIKVSGNNASRIFNITNTANAVLLSNLTLTNGDADTNNGGAVLNVGPGTTLNRVSVQDSIAATGGGVRNNTGAVLTVNNSEFVNNATSLAAAGGGGGIFNNGGTVTISNTTFAHNTSVGPFGGGGLLNQSANNGTVTISRSTFQENSASAGPGGGIFNNDNNAQALRIFNSTLVGNISNNLNAGLGGGGALGSFTGTVSLTHVTIRGNSDTVNNPQAAGGVSRTGGTINAVNTVISRNFSANQANPNVNTNAINGTNTTNFVSQNNPGLGGLGNNGGDTLTLLPLVGSPLIDAGTNGQTGPDGQPLTTDQRGPGFPRQVGTNVDIGATERFSSVTTTTLEVLQDGTTITGTSTALPVTLRATVTSATTGITPTGSVNFFRDPTPNDPTDDPILLNRTPIDLDATGIASLPGLNLPSTSGLFARYIPSSRAFAPSTSETDTITATVRDTVGVFDPNAVFALLNQNTSGEADFSYSFGIGGDLPVVGNWTGSPSRVSLPGVVRNAGGFLQWTLSDDNPPVLPNLPSFAFGTAGLIPLAGDWNGSGTDGIGLFDPNSGAFALKNAPSAGAPDFTFTFGSPGVLPVAGDWDGDGTDTVGVYNPATGQWFLAGNSPATGFPALLSQFTFGGQPGSRPVAGDWNGSGTDGIGVFFPQPSGFGGFLLRQTPDSGPADVNGGNVILAGLASWLPVSGNWGPAPTNTNELLNPPSANGGNGGMAALMLGQSNGLTGQALSDGQLQSVVGDALGRLASLGADAVLLNTLTEARFVLGDLPRAMLGRADPAAGVVVIDTNAAGQGWYVGGTAGEGSGAVGGFAGVDLLSAVLHEMGHLAGHGHDDGLMGATLSAGVRHTDALDALFGAGLGHEDHDEPQVAIP